MGARRICWVKVIRGEEAWICMNEETLEDAQNKAKTRHDVIHVLESQWDDPPQDGLDLIE